MIANSDNTSPLPITAEPDWSKPVVVTFTHATQVFGSRSGKEQRKRVRRSPKATIMYTVSGLSLAEAQLAMDAAAAQYARLCIVPFWTEGTITITSIVSDAVTVGVDPRRDFFAPGQYVYLDDGTNQYFRLISSVSDRILTLTADGSSPAFGANARIFPCRLCRRLPNESDALEATNTTSHELKLSYQTTA